MIFVQNIQSVMIWSEIKRILRLLFISVVFFKRIAAVH